MSRFWLVTKVIADMTANIPHPYSLADAELWINTHEPLFDSGKGIVYAITLKESGELIVRGEFSQE
ncbi:hypothetical protein P4S64_20150 [Vibrio sp. M60_M31a]